MDKLLKNYLNAEEEQSGPSGGEEEDKPKTGKFGMKSKLLLSDSSDNKSDDLY